MSKPRFVCVFLPVDEDDGEHVGFVCLLICVCLLTGMMSRLRFVCVLCLVSRVPCLVSWWLTKMVLREKDLRVFSDKDEDTVKGICVIAFKVAGEVEWIVSFCCR